SGCNRASESAQTASHRVYPGGVASTAGPNPAARLGCWLGLLCQLRHRLVEELDALGQVGVQVLQVAVLVFDRQVALVALALQLLEHALGVAAAAAPGDVVAAAELVEVLEVRVQYAAFELLELLDRDEIGPHPVAGVGAGADQLSLVLAGLEHLVGRPGL